MDRTLPFEIGYLTDHHLADAMRLVGSENWNQTASDWLRLLRLEPGGCFAAWRDGRLAATITTTTYGSDLAWIAMMFVAAEYRRMGLATTLMQTAMDYLRRKGVVTVKLDATAVGRPLYEGLGFEPEGVIERWETIAQPAQTVNLREIDVQIWPDVKSLDRRAFGVDRERVLDSLLHDCCVPPLAALDPRGQLQGFAMARHRLGALYIGPVIAVAEQTALSLLDRLMTQMAGERIYLDLNTRFGPVTPALLARNFTKRRELTRMRYGKESSAGASSAVFAIAGPETG